MESDVLSPQVAVFPGRVILAIQGQRDVVIPNADVAHAKVRDPSHTEKLFLGQSPPMVKTFVLRIKAPAAQGNHVSPGAQKTFIEFEKALQKEIKDLQSGNGQLRAELLKADIQVFTVQATKFLKGRSSTKISTYVFPRGAR